MKARFSLGQLFITQGALQSLTRQEVYEALKRHVCGDWGDLDPEDCKENEYSVNRRLRLLSAYKGADGARFWVITSADRSETTVLLPDEY